jgi:uncharacterized membrane protein
MSKHRLELFSDAVIAIILTIMVLDPIPQITGFGGDGYFFTIVALRCMADCSA